jgi:hypothetical protein
MVNLLEQAINSDDGDRAARIIQRLGHPTTSSVPASSASGCKPKRDFWVK